MFDFKDVITEINPNNVGHNGSEYGQTSHTTSRLVFSPEKYQVVKTSGNHDIYNCPFCLKRRGKEDTDGKLYWNRVKEVGFCFKCEAKPVSASDTDISFKFNNLVDSFIETQSSSDSIIDTLVSSSIDYKSIVPELNQVEMDYLLSRSAVYQFLVEPLQIRGAWGDGIVLPFYYNDSVVSYILRYLKPPYKSKKYHIPSGMKYLYSPNKAIRNDHDNFIQVTLVEGVFDAIAAYLMGYQNPMAILGLYCTATHVETLREIGVEEIHVMLDDFDKSLELKRDLKSKLPTCDIDIIPTNGSDPEEILNAGLVKSKNGLLETVHTQLNKLLESNPA